MKIPRQGTRLIIALISAGAAGAQAETASARPSLFEGKPMATVVQDLRAQPQRTSSDTCLLGTTEFLGAVEKLCQRFHQLGLNYEMGRTLPVPFLRLELPVHDKPSVAHAEDVRAALIEFYQSLERVEGTLRPLKGTAFKLEVPLGKMALDFDGNGTIGEKESFLTLYRQFNRRAGEGATQPSVDGAAFNVVFDGADVYWILAYTHFLRGMSDLFLAHDGGELFKTVGQMFFVRADTPLREATPLLRDDSGRRWTGIADAIGLIHQLRLPVQDPQRLARVRTHWLAMIGESRTMLTALDAETDDDREWLPNARQSSGIGVRLNQEQIGAWRMFLGEMEDILEGKKLLPHWRFAPTHGFNVKRFLTEAKTTDLVLLLQGTASVPFIDEGKCTSDQTWREINRLFQGNFIGFAIWIN